MGVKCNYFKEFLLDYLPKLHARMLALGIFLAPLASGFAKNFANEREWRLVYLSDSFNCAVGLRD